MSNKMDEMEGKEVKNETENNDRAKNETKKR
jgi:hypothetical protein